MNEKRYSREEMEEILRRALSNAEEDGVAHDDLVAAAAEVGISQQAIEHAALTLRNDRARLIKREEVKRRRRSGFFRHLSIYAIINAGIGAIDLISGPGSFVLFGAVLWGIPLALHGLRTFFPSEASLERGVDRAIKREAKEARKRAFRQLPADTPEERSARKRAREQKFERLVEDGVDVLLRKAAEQLDKQKGSPRVRVAGEEADDGGTDSTSQRYRRPR